MPTPPLAGTVTEREPVVAIVSSGVVLLNLILAAVFAFVTLEPGQVAALFAIPNGIGSVALSWAARNRVAPFEAIDLPAHAIDEGYDVDARPELEGL